MRIEKIAYEQLYPTGVYANQRYRVEIAIEENDWGYRDTPPTQEEAAQQAFAKAKELVEKTFTALNPHINWNETKDLGVYENFVSETQPRDTVDNIIAAINSSKSLVTLKWLEPTGENASNERIMNAYNEKLKSFQ